MDSNRMCIKMSKAITQGREVIKACTDILRAMSIKCDRSCNNHAKHLPMIGINEEEQSVHADPIGVKGNVNSEAMKPKKQRRLKPHMCLSSRRKVERSCEIKYLMVKIANLPEDKNEYTNQCAHVAEYVLNSFNEM